MNNMQAVRILSKAQEEGVAVLLELDVGERQGGKVVQIMPFDDWDAELQETFLWRYKEGRIWPICVVELNAAHVPGDGMVDKYRETGITTYVSVEYIVSIHYDF